MTWDELRSARPDLSAAGEELPYQFGVGLAFLATVRLDGGPRIHPMCPLIHEGGLYAFLVPSPKRTDLLRDGRFSMHSFPTDSNEDAFYLTGVARPADDEDLRGSLVARFLAERRSSNPAVSVSDDQRLFEFQIETCMLTRTSGHGDPAPEHTVWHAPS
jgi:hypothetical protein